jgi:hypothetical protein
VLLGILTAAVATRRLQTIGETAIQVRRCLVVPDEHEALRWVALFIAEFKRLAPKDQVGTVADEPPPTGDRRWDAMLAGVVEQLCFEQGLAIPSWVMQPGRFLDRGVFVHGQSQESV